MSIRHSVIIAAASLVAGIVIGGYVQGLRWDADAAELGRQQSDNISAGQQAIIARQSFDFHRYNEIARNANQYAINIQGKSDEKQIVYRTIIKRDPVSGKCVPDDVADRLLDYTHRLRASAMRTTASGTDTTGAGAAATGCRLTYGQAVYWIDPLLTAIDQANSQLAGILDAESDRARGTIAVDVESRKE
ncbi:hypothetical protein AB6D34_09335 [Pectobacterium brasiliense]|uniref:Uncharacterized protein n=1 Tax=Pectobacterium brasiliense TaxID=180957 RepID=A0A433NJF9_9GAMM|nr:MULTISPECIES: hypothetical protein [Pectobacterium]GKW27786.1 hypothetical protein PEC331060_09640 [Pectobacterium carotovorum subsp. carotovorum]MBN3046525.1 hypothetical protein [Pectobacterium brasiliense]MBN3056778.1 hypothetical protein [Pectobacterium brasiliense]MBN3075342.1 hypothetical protein [Pectobacterium brasiliense]MBN3083532.1 hypothetical protein [Pectobacterium brasiliense]